MIFNLEPSVFYMYNPKSLVNRLPMGLDKDAIVLGIRMDDTARKHGWDEAWWLDWRHIGHETDLKGYWKAGTIRSAWEKFKMWFQY